MLPEGLTGDGLNVVRSAKNAGVDLDLVNIMAMDYGRSAQDYGDLAIQAVRATKDQIKTLYGNSDAAGLQDGRRDTDARQERRRRHVQPERRPRSGRLRQHQQVGFVSFWEATRDRNACTGALFQCTNIPQTAFEFSKIFAGFRG